MKAVFSILIIFFNFISIELLAQNQAANAYDFWVGKWIVTWQNKDGSTTQGSNFIEKTVDEKVLQEHFNDPSTGFKGTSISVYNPNTKTWHQAWADNQGGYYNFIGETEGDKKIFKTLPSSQNGQTLIQRMVFYNITEDSFTWDWESTKDGGKNWTLNWRIVYQRK